MTEETIIALEGVATAPAKRFVRNRDVPQEKLLMRERMIEARVMNGWTAVEAARRLGYKNSAQLSLIESGERKVPNDWQFLVNMSNVYSVSVDFLLGRSPYPERDAVAAESFAMLRNFDTLVQAQVRAMTAAFIQYGKVREAARTDLQALESAALEVSTAVARLRELNPDLIQELRGGARAFTAVERLETAIIPLKETISRRVKAEEHCLAIAQGKEGPLSSVAPEVPQMPLFGE